MKLNYARIHEMYENEEIEFCNKIAKEAKEELDAMIPECPEGEEFKEIKEAINKGCKYLNSHYWSDIYPGIITRVINSKTIEVLELDHIADIRGNCGRGRGFQNWVIFKNDDQCPKHIFTLRKNGKWVKKGSKMNNGLSGSICNAPNYYYDWGF